MNLEHLNLSNNKILQKGFTEFFRKVAESNKLRSLDISYNCLDKPFEEKSNDGNFETYTFEG